MKGFVRTGYDGHRKKCPAERFRIHLNYAKPTTSIFASRFRMHTDHATPAKLFFASLYDVREADSDSIMR
jgi:hypothetical protein